MNFLKRWLMVSIIGLALSFGCSFNVNLRQSGYYDNSPTRGVIEDAEIGVFKLFTKHTWIYEGVDVPTEDSGTGFVYGDYVITARHVVKQDQYVVASPFGMIPIEGAKLKERKSWVIHDGKEIELELVADYPDYEIALLKRPQELPAIPFECGKSGMLERGDWVYIIGHAFGWDGPLMAKGIVAGYGEPNVGLEDIIPHTWSVVVYDVNVNPGHSGSPIYALRNGKPEFVGVINAMIPGTGVAFGVGIDTVRAIITTHENGYGHDEG